MLDPGELRDTLPSELQVSSVLTDDHVYEPMMHSDDYEIMVSEACSNNSVEIGALSSDEAHKRPASMRSDKFAPWFGMSPFANVGSVEFELDSGDDYYSNAAAASLLVFNDEGTLEAMETQLQHNQFAMALGATYPDSSADNDLFVALE